MQDTWVKERVGFKASFKDKRPSRDWPLRALAPMNHSTFLIFCSFDSSLEGYPPRPSPPPPLNLTFHSSVANFSL